MSSFIQSLKPYQQNLLTSAVALVASVIILGFFFGVFLLLKLFVATFASVLWPLAVAGIIAMILRPVVSWLQGPLRMGRIPAIIVIYLLTLVVIGLILGWGLPLLFDQTVKFVQRLPEIGANLQEALTNTFPMVQEYMVGLLGESYFEQSKTLILDQIQTSLTAVPSAAQDVFAKVGQILAIGTGLAIIPVYLFFFLSSDRDIGQDLESQLSFLRSEWRKDILFLIREFVGSLEAFFRGQILIGLIIGILLAIGFSAVGVNFGIGLGLLIGALNIIPYLGTIIGLGTVLPIAYFQPDGGWVLASLTLMVFILTQMLEGYVLTPKIMGKQTGLHPLTIIIAIFFWGVALDGLLGMVLAIPLTAFFVVAWRLAKRKYLRYFSGEEIESDEGKDAQSPTDIEVAAPDVEIRSEG